MFAPSSHTQANGSTIRRLTDTEATVLTLIALGKSSKEAAADRRVAKRTVDFHLKNIYAKLKVSNRVSAILLARRLGLIPLMRRQGEALTATVRLTETGVEVLELLAKGLGYNEIAKKLLISRRTVDFHAGHIFDKLGASNRIQAINIAIGSGLVDNSNWCA